MSHSLIHQMYRDFRNELNELGARIRQGTATPQERLRYKELSAQHKSSKKMDEHFGWENEYWELYEEFWDQEIAGGSIEKVASNQAHTKALKAVAKRAGVNRQAVRKAILHAKKGYFSENPPWTGSWQPRPKVPDETTLL